MNETIERVHKEMRAAQDKIDKTDKMDDPEMETKRTTSAIRK